MNEDGDLYFDKDAQANFQAAILKVGDKYYKQVLTDEMKARLKAELVEGIEGYFSLHFPPEK